MKKKMLRICCAIMASVLVLAACAQPAPPQGADEGAQAPAGTEDSVAAGSRDELVVVMNALPITLDPVANNDLPSARARRMVFDTLLMQDEHTLELQEGLATHWYMPNPETVELQLREGVYFHNGDPFTAEAVRVSLERAIASPVTSSMFNSIEEIEIVDDHNVVLHLNMAFIPILNALAANQASIVNPGAVAQAEAEGTELADNPVGTGPLVFQEFVSGSHMTLRRNDNYWGQTTAFETLTFRGISEQANRLIEIETGNADIALDIAPIDVPHAEASPDVEVVRGDSTSITYIGFNMLQGVTSDIRVRHAIQHAIDLEAIVNNAYAGTSAVANSLASPFVWGYVSQEPFEFDLERAAELLEEAGFPGGEGLELSIWYNAGNQQRADISEMMQNQLRAVGIELSVETLEWAAYLDRTANAEHDMFILGWIAGNVDPDTSLYMLLHSDNMGTPGNRTFFNNPRVDYLLDAGRSELDYEERLAIYAEIQRIVWEESPKIIGVHVEEIHAVRPGVNGFVATPNGNNRFDRVYFD